MPKERVAFQCRACGLSFEGLAGAADGSFNRFFWCPKERKATLFDVRKPGFSGKCPDCSAMLDLLADFPLDACPKCHAPQGVQKDRVKGGSGSKETGEPLRRPR